MAVDTRPRMHLLMVQTIADEAAKKNWNYHEVRPMSVPNDYHGQTIAGDCSKGCQYLAKWADGPDPMGMAFGVWGNSETMCMHLQHLDHPIELKVGDYVTFGVRGDQHATCVMEAGEDPLLWSFGHQGAPNPYRLSQDGREYQLLRNPVPDYVPTNADKLRAKTGYFSWVAWKLGEGDWFHHMPSDPNVRPNVPKHISPNWWKRYTQFLLNRKRANKPTTG